MIKNFLRSIFLTLINPKNVSFSCQVRFFFELMSSIKYRFFSQKRTVTVFASEMPLQGGGGGLEGVKEGRGERLRWRGCRVEFSGDAYFAKISRNFIEIKVKSLA